MPVWHKRYIHSGLSLNPMGLEIPALHELTIHFGLPSNRMEFEDTNSPSKSRL
jgi:hypothetical protein